MAPIASSRSASCTTASSRSRHRPPGWPSPCWSPAAAGAAWAAFAGCCGCWRRASSSLKPMLSTVHTTAACSASPSCRSCDRKASRRCRSASGSVLRGWGGRTGGMRRGGAWGGLLAGVHAEASATAGAGATPPVRVIHALVHPRRQLRQLPLRRRQALLRRQARRQGGHALDVEDVVAAVVARHLVAHPGLGALQPGGVVELLRHGGGGERGRRRCCATAALSCCCCRSERLMLQPLVPPGGAGATPVEHGQATRPTQLRQDSAS